MISVWDQTPWRFSSREVDYFHFPIIIVIKISFFPEAMQIEKPSKSAQKRDIFVQYKFIDKQKTGQHFAQKV